MCPVKKCLPFLGIRTTKLSLTLQTRSNDARVIARLGRSSRRFKKQVEKAGVLSEMKKRQHYEKPSVMRKKKKAAARKRLMKKIRKMNMA